MLFVETQECSARRQVVVDNVENFSINALFKPGQDNRVSAVVNVDERHRIGSTEVQENTERSQTDSSRY